MRHPFYLVGPTASGKTDIAIALARQINGEIINGDTFQLYRDLPTLTALPTVKERADVPHHLFGILDPLDACDAETYAKELAQPAIDEVLSRGKTPIVVGGGGLYLKALTHGLADLPPADLNLREELATLSAEARLERLLSLDPRAADATDLANDRYVTRALEISILTGRPSSEVKPSWDSAPPPDLFGTCLTWPREELYERINHRTGLMFDAGVVDEVSALIQTVDPPDLTAGVFRSIGAPIIAQHLAGEIDMPSAIEAVAQATRRYAKRQRTWFRRESWLEPIAMAPPPNAARTAATIIARFPHLEDEPPRHGV